MNPVFEKIIEELEEMIHPKQLYFCKYARGGCKHLDNDDKDCIECVVENAIEIVKQEAEQYNNGWIPCSLRLPENISTVILQVKEIEKPTFGWYGNITGWKLTEEDFLKLKDFTVVAWQPLPQPYQLKGE